MGLKREYLEFIERAVGSFEGKRMLELGNQRISRRARVGARTGKAYYTALGAAHTSLDFNGKDGAIPLDLSQPIDKPDWRGHFDVITNAGTTEHVEPFAAQYVCFRNLHEWLKPGGVFIHIVPAIEELDASGRWMNHCNHYYAAAFFEMLARENDYELLESTIVNELHAAALRKRSDAPFMTDRAEFERTITRREGGLDYTRPQPLWSRVRRRLVRWFHKL